MTEAGGVSVCTAETLVSSPFSTSRQLFQVKTESLHLQIIPERADKRFVGRRRVITRSEA